MTFLSSITAFSQYITRGPDIGEIYFLGPTTNGYGLYYSTDFGETATFIDGTMDYVSIAADKTKGGIYCIKYPSNLYYNDNYGYVGSWEFKYADDISDMLLSGVEEGHVFSDCWMHSEDYGSSFTVHSLNGWFGSLKYAAIDNIDENIGYALVYSVSIPDTIYLFRTFDKFENVNIIQKYNLPNGLPIQLNSGNVLGEVYMFNKYYGSLNYSYDYAENFDFVEYFNFNDYYTLDFIGGKQTGEVYFLYNFVNMMWQNAHIYILHSTDYGKTFEVFHPFSKGNEPVLANFSIVNKEIFIATPVEFSNFSIGEITEYQWDFENDGIIDSYEEFPTHIYQDTGYYSVKLSVVGLDSTNTFIKENYIHVIDTITSNQDIKFQEINISPNPFIDKISIETRPDFKLIEILDLNGKSHLTKTIEQGNKTEIIDLRKLEKGIYILKIKTEGQYITKKILKI